MNYHAFLFLYQWLNTVREPLRLFASIQNLFETPPFFMTVFKNKHSEKNTYKINIT